MFIQIFVTGGTFDKEYDEINQSLRFRKTHLPEILRLGRSCVDTAIDTLMLKDSLDITADDRDLIVGKCANSDSKNILITHGTDTMVKTAEAIAKRVNDKTVILTGAMIPYAFGSSDGLFNLGSALAFTEALPPGVYIAMNGQYFPYDNVRKNLTTGYFEPLRD